ncbi:DUF1513 domain-containing protein [Taklimakanibacter lacteus]|uniref:DUF1513 domain-containing protein n=1 Tax=Taklimakanibacter lacteus TaxID=2268456 RepID=UPI000E66B529
MRLSRRAIVQGLATALAAGLMPHRASAGRAAPLYVSCRMDAEGKASAAMFSLDGEELFSTILPSRGHDATVRPATAEIVVFARRPGNWFAVIDAAKGRLLRTVISDKARHFYGHGVFTPDGRLLYATENDTQTGDGILGIYDASNAYARIGEISSRGIGPHDIAFLPDGKTLVIANGGLRTLPGSGREVLNPDDIKPNIALVDADHDRTLAALELDRPHQALSIRHMAVAQDRTVVFGCQYQGNPNDLPPLVGTVSPDGKIQLLDMPEEELLGMANYVGSISLDRNEDVIAATSPQGGSVALWNRRTGAFLTRERMSDVCGVAALPAAHDFLLTSGNDGVRSLHEGAETLPRLSGVRLRSWIWDNHLLEVEL